MEAFISHHVQAKCQQRKDSLIRTSIRGVTFAGRYVQWSAKWQQRDVELADSQKPLVAASTWKLRRSRNRREDEAKEEVERCRGGRKL